MGRPKSDYKFDFCAPYNSFKPQDCACDEWVDVTSEEIESLRLKNIKDLNQTQAAKKMGVSQSTFQRILTSAYKKVSLALIEGRELRIIPKKD